MFSWICPQCGHDVPPSKTECPYCAERALQATQPVAPPPPQYQQAPPQWQPPAPPPPPPPPPPVYQQAYAPPQHQAPQYQQPYPPPPQYQQHPQAAQQPMAWPPPQQKTPPPAWLVGGGFAVALILVFGGIYYFMSKGDAGNSGSKAAIAVASKAGSAASPLQRSIEVAGLRFVNAGKGSSVKFVVVNHSTAPVSDLQGTVTLWAGTNRSDEDAIGTFNLNVDVVEAGGSKEMTAPLKTKLKPYEMPDWQNASAEVTINAQ